MKLKTHKAASKRFKISPNKKIIQRRTRQDHFNAREGSNKTRSKRKNKLVSSTESQKIRRLMSGHF